MRSNATGSNNIAIGAEALVFPKGNENVAMGNLSMWVGSGNNNVAVGSGSLFFSTGNSNTAIGDRTLFNNHAGSFNVALGANATVIENQSSSIAIGAGASANGSNSTALGSGAISNASNKVRIGNAAVTVIEGQVPFSFPSDGRYKFNVREDVSGLDFILQLRPITYQFDVKRFDNQTGNYQEASNSSIAVQASYDEAAQIRRSGFIAQEVEKAAVKSGYDFSGVNKPKTEADHYSLSYESFVVPLVKAVQEQQQIINSQNKRMDEQERKIELLIRELKELQKK
jgi:autotransporter adhesin